MNDLELLLKNTNCSEADLICIAYQALEENNYAEFGIHNRTSLIWFEVFLDEKGIMTFKHDGKIVFQADY
ncbi:TPA: hypothetical protein QDB11_002365 [Burkholderia vietnamiensis]|uniref:hypothetical protein n=1 Tax=Burkholderia vietnamiensis TaxID=60552 RepID=UPI00264FA450|nr:hypothetical protein [Burkholderia vietnamiensis]MDN8113008.1 hypothetical protein [Burkholderia vietnamiensis]HDR9137716.1 hypothetical protein [Burkholderia vietnamiensis]